MPEFYENFFSEALKGNIALLDDSIKVLLVSSDYVFNPAHVFRSDLYSEVVGAGYVAGGKELASKSVVLLNGVAVFDAADVLWPGASITARRAILYKNFGLPAADVLICAFDFGSDVSSSNGDFALRWSANGVFDFGAQS